MKVYLIRHGRTEADEKHLYCGTTDLSLSEKGIEELRQLKTQIAYPDPEGKKLITSGKLRCNQTLGILFGNVYYSVDPKLSEMNFGAFEMRTYEELKHDPSYMAWITGDNEANIAPGGESGDIMIARVWQAYESVMRFVRQDTILVVHGGTIASVMAHLFPYEGKNRYEWQPSFGRGYCVDPEEKRYTVL